MVQWRLGRCHVSPRTICARLIAHSGCWDWGVVPTHLLHRGVPCLSGPVGTPKRRDWHRGTLRLTDTHVRGCRDAVLLVWEEQTETLLFRIRPCPGVVLGVRISATPKRLSSRGRLSSGFFGISWKMLFRVVNPVWPFEHFEWKRNQHKVKRNVWKEVTFSRLKKRLISGRRERPILGRRVTFYRGGCGRPSMSRGPSLSDQCGV